MASKTKVTRKKSSDTVIYINGRIYTVDNDADPNWHKHPKEALVVAPNGTIKFVGSSKDLSSLSFRRKSNTITVDLKGSTVLPGFHDTLMHALEAGSQVGGTCNLPAMSDPAGKDTAKAIRTAVGKQKGTEWLLGHGFSLISMLEYVRRMRMVNSAEDAKTLLDKLVTGSGTNSNKSKLPTPAVMVEETGHVMWANTEALKRAGMDGKMPVAVRGGLIMKNQYGEPNGVLFGNAGSKLLELATDSSKYPTVPQLNYDGLLWSLKQLARAGITSVTESPCYWTRGHHEVWARAEKEGKLNVRATLGLWLDPAMDDQEQISKLKQMYNRSSDFIQMSQVRVEMDGVLSHTTAALLEEYEVDYNIPRDGKNKGILYFSQERLRRYLRALQNLSKFEGGFDVDIVAVGDRAVREALDALEAEETEEGENGYSSRHRITGVQLVHQDDLRRFAKLGVLVNAQVSGDWGMPSTDSSDHLVKLIGSSRSKNVIPLRSLTDADATVSLGSDWDMCPKNPLLGIANAVTRGKQAVSLKTAIEMYTINGAYSMRQEERTGSLTVGKEADLVVLDRDIFQTKVEELEDIKVLMTMVAGREVYRNPNF